MNVGIYLTIIEQFSVGLLAGILAVATPSIVGASTPGIAPWLFAIFCFVVCATQSLGFLGVFKEKATLFSRYTQINTLAVSAVFGVAATWIITSATRHDTAKAACIKNFFSNITSTNSAGANIGSSLGADSTANEGEEVCNIFTWVDVGIMGGLWLVMLIFQGYLLLLTHWYASTQQADHTKYYSIYSVEDPQGIALGERQREDVWDPRPSTDSWSGSLIPRGDTRAMYQDHGRQGSDATERGYGVGADSYADKPAQYGYSASGAALGVSGGQTRQASEGMTEATFNPSGAYPSSGSVQPPPMGYGSAPERKGTFQSYQGGAAPQQFAPPPQGVRLPNAEEYHQGEGYPGTAPYIQQNYAESADPSYQPQYSQPQPYYQR